VAFSEAERSRYARQMILPELGEEGQLRLRNGSVLIVGAGGLGSPAAIYCAAAGVGRIGLVDADAVDPTNLHRQILYGTGDIGRPKLDAARERLEGVNPHVAIELHHGRLTASNALEIFARYDVVIDGTDNFPTRYLINDAATLSGKPNVYGSVFRFEGQASVFNWRGGPCYRCLYPEPPPADLIPSCAESGVLGVLPGIIGTIQASQAIQLLAGFGEPLSGRLLLFDALRMTFRSVALERRCGEHAPVTQLIDEEGFCKTMSNTDINVRELAAKIESGEDLLIVDVREPHEWESGHLENATHIPMRQVQARLAEIPRDRDVVVVCRSGNRSGTVERFLRDQGFTRVRNLAGGMMAWKRDIDPGMRVA
jgi:adenylyltransferase/sulfurtransferase